MRFSLRRWNLAIIFAAATAAQAGAQPGADSGSDEIVIEGMRNPEREVERFVDALTQAPVRGQLARFDWQACPAVTGLAPAQNAAVVARLRQVAEAAAIPLAPLGCQPNAIVIATSDKEAMMGWLRREAPAFFRDPLGQRIRIADGEGPAVAWQVEGRLDADGQPLGVNASAGDSGTANHYVVNAPIGPSRITAASRPHFLASILIVELDALAGLTTTQMADYAAMRIFARTDPDRLARSSAPTILNLLSAPMGSEVPLTLTEWDLGFLRALYGSTENHYATQQRAEMRRQLERDLETARQAPANVQ